MRIILILIILLTYSAFAYGDELQEIDGYFDALQKKNELLHRQEELDSLIENGNNMISHLQGSLAENPSGPLNQKLKTMIKKKEARNKEREDEKKANQAEISKIDKLIKKTQTEKKPEKTDDWVFYSYAPNSPFYEVLDSNALRIPRGITQPAIGGQAQEYKPINEALDDL